MARKYTEARSRANKAYDAKTYKKYTVLLRIDDDAKIIEDLENAKAQGLSSRQWIRKLWSRR